MKKAIEISVLCGLDIFLVIFDRDKQKMYEYNSIDEFDSRVVSKLLSADTKMQFQYEKYQNTDYNSFVNDKGDKSECVSRLDFNDSKQRET